MSFRFWRRLKIAPGLTLNLSRSGGSLSFGPRGAHLTMGPRGLRTTAGIPGTGLFWTRTPAKGRRAPNRPTVAVEDRLDLGFFQRLFTPGDEKAFVDGCRELSRGDEDAAVELLQRAADLVDAAFLLGFLHLKRGEYGAAVPRLEQALQAGEDLGRTLQRYGIAALWSLPITEELTVHVGAEPAAALLALTEARQAQGDLDGARECLRELRRRAPDDVVVKVSLAELLLESPGTGPAREVVELAAGVENESAAHAALLLYQGRALRRLGLSTAARDALTAALRRRKDRPEELLNAARYERALVYEERGRKSRARAELEKLYADDPAYADVAARLGL